MAAYQIEPRRRGPQGEEPGYMLAQQRSRLLKEKDRQQREKEQRRNDGAQFLDIGPNPARPVEAPLVQPERDFEIGPNPYKPTPSAPVVTDDTDATDQRAAVLRKTLAPLAVQTDPNAPTFEIEPRPQPEDVGIIPPSARMQAVLDASGEDAYASANPAAMRAQPAATASAPDPIKEMSDHLHRLQTEPVVDRNGRLRSFFSNFMRAVGPQMERAQAIAAAHGRAVTWADLFGGLAHGAGAGLVGVFDPKSDEFAARMEAIERTQGSLDKLIERQRKQAAIEAQQARTEASRAKGQTPAPDDPKVRNSKMRELSARMKLTGGRFDPQDARSAELARDLQITPRAKGSSFNAQRLKVVGDNLVYVDFDDDGHMVMDVLSTRDGKPLPPSEEEEIRNAIAVEVLNVNRGREGQPPLQINPNRGGAPSTPTAAPAPGAQPGSSASPAILTPTGAPAPPSQRNGRGGYSGRGRRGAVGAAPRGGGSRGDSIGESIANNRTLDLIGQFEAAKRRGQLDEARGIANEIRNNPNTRDAYEVGEDAQGNPYVKRKAQRSHASVDRQAAPGRTQTITRMQLLRYAATHRMTEAEAEAAAADQGYEIEEDGQR